MKTKLLFLLSLFSSCCFSQYAVNSFHVTDMSAFEVVTSATPLNQTTAGANVNWNFSQLTSTGSSLDLNSTATPEELITYPNTNFVVQTTADLTGTGAVLNRNFFTTTNTGMIAITGLNTNGLTLNYATDNANIGSFPMNYGYSYTDSMAGTYHYGIYTGTFSGTIVTAVDAFGTLTIDGFAAASGSVNRLKSVQTMNLNYGAVPNVGTMTQTTYNYYSNSGVLKFRNTTTVISVPLMSINQTITQMEVYTATLLSIDDNIAESNEILTAPNPVEDFLNIKIAGNQSVQSISISDISGKSIVKLNNPGNSIDLSQLQKGIYIATITTDRNIFTRKLVKK